VRSQTGPGGRHNVMNRKATLLFVAASVIWGSSFLLIRVAVRDISPPRSSCQDRPRGHVLGAHRGADAGLSWSAPEGPRGRGPDHAQHGIVNTGLLSWVYFALVRQAGAAVTPLISYVVPVVALVLGVSLLGEILTIGAAVGLVLIASGTWLATRARRPRADRQAAGAASFGDIPRGKVRFGQGADWAQPAPPDR